MNFNKECIFWCMNFIDIKMLGRTIKLYIKFILLLLIGVFFTILCTEKVMKFLTI